MCQCRHYISRYMNNVLVHSEDTIDLTDLIPGFSSVMDRVHSVNLYRDLNSDIQINSLVESRVNMGACTQRRIRITDAWDGRCQKRPEKRLILPTIPPAHPGWT